MIILKFSLAEEAPIPALATQAGLTPSEYVMRLVREHLQKLDENKGKSEEVNFSR